MNPDAKRVEKIYSGKVGKKYEYSMPPFFARWKKKAIQESSLKKGDHVIIFCCGTGLDFASVLKKIGKEGKITAFDFSTEMLRQAKEKIEKNQWNNIKLIEADATKSIDSSGIKFDAGICTLGLSIIPNYQLAYKNLLSCVKEGGEIIIGDMQLATGWLSIFNPLTLAMSKKFGGTREGHKNSLKILSMMEKELIGMKKRTFFFGAYYYCICKKNLIHK